MNAECRGNGKERVCLAGHDPASHPVRAVGTQRVALDGDSMRLRVKARKETEGEPVETYTQCSKKDMCRKTAVLFIKEGLIVQKTKDVQFFLN